MTHQLTKYEHIVLMGLQLKEHMYGGTVSFREVAARRRKAKAQRKARRLNR